MKSLVSDFKLAKYFLTLICKKYNTDFVDCPIFFNETLTHPIFKNGDIVCPRYTNLAKTIFAIVMTYIENSSDITDYKMFISQQTAQSILRSVFTLVRSYIYSSGVFEEAFPPEPVHTQLHRESLTWILLKDFICPIYSVQPKDFRVICGKSGTVDTVRYVTKEDVDLDKIRESLLPFIFINLEVKNPVVRAGYLLHESLLANGLNPHEVLSEINADQVLKEKFVKFVRMAMVKDESVAEYFRVISLVANIPDLNVKTAQFAGETFNIMGLIEKMLEPARGNDWTAYKKLQPLLDELNIKIEEARKKSGLKEVPFEMMLRVQSEDLVVDPTKTVQALLSDDRVW